MANESNTGPAVDASTTPAANASTTASTTGPDTGTNTDANTDAGKTFTQSDLDRIVADRLARDRAAHADALDKAKKWDEHEEKSASELDKAVKAARKEGAAEVATQYLSRIAAAEIRSVAHGRIADVDALLENLDLSKFVTNDDVDTKAVRAWVDKISPPPAEKKTDDTPNVQPWADLGAGGRLQTTVDPGFGQDRVRNAYAKH